MQNIVTPPPIEPGGVFVHIGPHKTGTTAIQDSLFCSQEVLKEKGFVYFATGTHVSANSAVKAFARRLDRGVAQRIRASVRSDDWAPIQSTLAKSPEKTVLLSAEQFADLNNQQVSNFVKALGGRPIRVVLTLRSLAEIIPSQWQQFVKRGAMPSLDEWTRELFTPNSTARKVNLFWIRHRHDELLGRWVDAVGPERVSVVIVDSNDRAAIFRTFEQLIGLPPGTLQPGSRVNKSMSIEQAELVRESFMQLERAGMGKLFGDKGAWTAIHNYFLSVSDSSAGERPRLPDSARPAVVAVANEIVDAIQRSGVGVIGDLSALNRIPPSGTAQLVGANRAVPADLGGAMAVSLLRAAGIKGLRTREQYQVFLDEIPLKALMGAAWERLLQRVGIAPRRRG